ncbi:MAG: SUMF1/EgtB/PvdO family nonheme iron enzyme, partial [Deltaproteobacteria bacterium]|nr:SUMF1/EgtB/PvdO family nonheme iron enzyme [Deltaproteobacteria bacterium]
GLVNLLGNVREWTRDEDADGYDKLAANNPVANNYNYGGRIVKGGSYLSTYGKNFAGRLSYRDWIYSTGKDPAGNVPEDVGFRCAYTFPN